MPPLKSIAIPVKKPSGHRSKSRKSAALPESPRGNHPPAENRTQAQRLAPHPTHSYGVGEHLRMANGGRTLSRVAATCVVVSRLPYEGHGALLYRVRSETEQYERVVAEMDLSRAEAAKP